VESTETSSESSGTTKGKTNKHRKIEENNILQKLILFLDHEGTGNVSIQDFVGILYECFKRDVSNEIQEFGSQNEVRKFHRKVLEKLGKKSTDQEYYGLHEIEFIL
jgi:hypothetical protein